MPGNRTSHQPLSCRFKVYRYPNATIIAPSPLPAARSGRASRRAARASSFDARSLTAHSIEATMIAGQMEGLRVMAWLYCRNGRGRPPLRSDQPTCSTCGKRPRLSSAGRKLVLVSTVRELSGGNAAAMAFQAGEGVGSVEFVATDIAHAASMAHSTPCAPGGRAPPPMSFGANHLGCGYSRLPIALEKTDGAKAENFCWPERSAAGRVDRGGHHRRLRRGGAGDGLLHHDRR